MKRSRISFAFTLSVLLLMLFAGTALGEESPGGSVDTVRLTVTDGSFWEVPSLVGGHDIQAYECPGIPGGLTITEVPGSSTRTKKAEVQELSHGRKKITLRDIVWGTATDGDETYTYLYVNVATYRLDKHNVVHVKMEDTFVLQGDDFDYVVSFKWRWKYLAEDGLELVELPNNLNVSPFIFATADGFTENPDIIPHSWRQIYTNGFIFGCDPI